MPYKRFAVIGAGNLGVLIIDRLLAEKNKGKISTVVVVTRSDATAAHPDWVAKGAKFVVVDYDNPSTFPAAFENIDVAVSTISGAALPKQLDLAVAAKAASVKLFVPSEFGDPTNEAQIGEIFILKRKIQEKLKELDLPYSLFFTGMWTDFVFVPYFGWDFENGKVNIGGEGNAPITFTARDDILDFLTYTLTTLPASKLEWSIFRIEGERLSFNQIAARYESKTGKKLTVTHTPRSVLEANISKDPNDLLSLLPLVWDLGEGSVGEVNAADFYPGWNPKKVFDILGQ